MSPTLQIEHWPPARLRPSPRNPRRHAAAQLRQIEASIRAFHVCRPILARPDGEIIAGEAVWRAAQAAGHESVPVVVLAHLDARQAEAYRIADNRLALDATWDEALLAQILAELEAAAFDVPVLGFSDDDIAALLADPAVPADDGADHALPPPPVPETQPGDLWQLGEHRLICGDSTKPETYARLFAGARPARVTLADAATADLVFTDPPYGMAYDGGRARKQADVVFTDPPYGMSFGKGKAAGSTAKGALVKAHGMILNDDARGAALVALVRDALAQAKAHSSADAAFYICLTWRTYADFIAALDGAGLKLASCIVWDKQSIGLGWQHYRPQHEFIFYCRGSRWYGGKTESDVWQLSRGHTGEYVHPTQKPVALIERALANSSRPGDTVLDCFGGSGSTLIACERLNRRARLVELDPKYCDAIARRWEHLTGRKGARLAAWG